MNKIISQIESASHIEIEVTEEFLALGSALYTYILTRHKKVSFVCKTKEVNLKYSFLPWFEKLRATNYSSADLNLNLQNSFLEFFNTLKSLNVKINPKMATALYAALILETDNFTNSKTDGIFFAIASELIEYGADYKLCIQYCVKRATLSEFRLRAIMFKNMTLIENANIAAFKISEDELKASGTISDDIQEIMKDSFGLEYVKKAILVNEDNKIIKTLEKER